MIGKLAKAGFKAAVGAAGGGKKDYQMGENAITGAKNKARGTRWSADEQRGYNYFRRENKGATPADFNALPKAQRQQYVEMGKILGQSENQSGSKSNALASAGDAFTASSELKSEGKKGGGGVGSLIGALGKAFA